MQIARDITQKTQGIVRDAGRKIKKKDLLKLSRMEPNQQEQAAAQLASGAIRSADEFQSVKTPKQAKADKAAPYTLGGKRYGTLKESMADLKNPDKDCGYTLDTKGRQAESGRRPFQHGGGFCYKTCTEGNKV